MTVINVMPVNVRRVSVGTGRAAEPAGKSSHDHA